MANLTHHNHRNNIQKNISDFSNRKKEGVPFGDSILQAHLL